MLIAKKFVSKCINHGPEVALSTALCQIFSYSKVQCQIFWEFNEIKHKAVMRHLSNKNEYAEIFSEYERIQTFSKENTSKHVWTLWWQGEENAPDIVKLCHKSIKTHCKNCKLTVISKKNIADYISLPEYILEKVDNGVISLTHLSDIIRMNLLNKYGGLWLDSTIFVAQDIPDSIFELPYYTGKMKPQKIVCVSKAKWAGYLLAAAKGNPYISYMVTFFNKYWKKENSLIDYFLIDYATEIAYEKFDFYKNMLDAVPENNPQIFELAPILDIPFEEKKWKEYTKDTIFFKLAWNKKHLKNTEIGERTYYGYLCSLYNM